MSGEERGEMPELGHSTQALCVVAIAFARAAAPCPKGSDIDLLGDLD